MLCVVPSVRSSLTEDWGLQVKGGWLLGEWLGQSSSVSIFYNKKRSAFQGPLLFSQFSALSVVSCRTLLQYMVYVLLAKQ
jgi:hypothetical protein